MTVGQLIEMLRDFDPDAEVTVSVRDGEPPRRILSTDDGVTIL